jgi:hypothetical protein
MWSYLICTEKKIDKESKWHKADYNTKAYGAKVGTGLLETTIRWHRIYRILQVVFLVSMSSIIYYLQN